MSGQNPTTIDEAQQSDYVSELPSSLIPYILVKLPIKIIIRCKCVCKSWNRLILDPFFTKLYSKTSQFTSIALLQIPKSFTTTNPIDAAAFSFLEIGKNDDDVITTRFNLDPLIVTLNRTKETEFDKLLVGSVNGLLCFVLTPYIIANSRRYNFFVSNGDSFCVVNPLTGESVGIPQVKYTEDCVRETYGFGSTVDGDYYKIVRVVEVYDVTGGLRLEMNVITVGVDDKWRDFQDPAICDVFVEDGVALDGAIHWVDHKSDVNSIYAFDVGKEVGCRISGPSSNVVGGYLGVWDGHLCLVQENENELQFDVWTMREYGVAESWTKDVMLRNSILDQNLYQVVVPRTTRINGDLLLSIVSYEGDKSLISFDPKTNNYVKLEGVYSDKDTDSDLLEYVPCFSSLSGMISRQVTIRDS